MLSYVPRPLSRCSICCLLTPSIDRPLNPHLHLSSFISLVSVALLFRFGHDSEHMSQGGGDGFPGGFEQGGFGFQGFTQEQAEDMFQSMFGGGGRREPREKAERGPQRGADLQVRVIPVRRVFVACLWCVLLCSLGIASVCFLLYASNSVFLLTL